MCAAGRSTNSELELGRSRELALSVADVIAETPASDTLVIDIHELSQLSDFFVICAGENERQLRAIGRTLLEVLGAQGVRPRHSEGGAASGWLLVDYGDVVVHIFDVKIREFYGLEQRWAEAPTLLSIQ